VVGEVAVRVDAVADLGHAVSVVVAQVLPPQPHVVERVLVPVGVGNREEPELGRLEQLADLAVVGPPLVDVVVHQPPVDLGGDPLPGVLGGAVEDRRPRAVRRAASTLGQLDRDDLAALCGVAEDLELHQLGVVARRGVELVADASRLVVRAPDGEAAGRLRGCELPDRPAALDALELHVDAVPPEPVGLGLVEDHVELDTARDLSLVAHVDTRLREHGQLLRRHRRRVDVELVRVSARAGRRCRPGGAEAHAERGDEARTRVTSDDRRMIRPLLQANSRRANLHCDIAHTPPATGPVLPDRGVLTPRARLMDLP
jgi:hypothetical protein